MITLDLYRSMLSNNGDNISQVHKNRSDDIMNIMFKNDVGYKSVYILTQDNGWQYYDARFSKHSTASISKDNIDYYLQFRPGVVFPIGTYVFIPNETEYSLGFSTNSPEYPFKDSNFDINKLWIIVGRDYNNQFTRYMVLQCNWNLKWVDNSGYANTIMNCYCCLRSASSYTSGIWNANYLTTLDQITALWMPNLQYIYGDKLSDYGLCDNERLNHNERVMISVNTIYPKVYVISKVIDLNPIGLLKLTLKQDEFNEYRDSIEYMVCDYYDESGKIIPENTDILSDTDNEITSEIYWRFVNEDGELIENDGNYVEILSIGVTSYFEAVFSDTIDDDDIQWVMSLVNEDNEYTNDECKYYEGLMILKKYDNNLLSIRPSKAGSLKGKQFTLTVSDLKGNCSSSIVVEVSEE